MSAMVESVHFMKRFAILVLSFFTVSSISPAPLLARPRSASNGPDGAYISALAAANRFLAAWQAQDRESALVMLTNEAKEGRSEAELEGLFSPGDNAAYEIGRGTKLKAGRYSFPVTLLNIAPGHRVQTRLSQVVVVKAGKEDWAVDRLP